MQSVWAGGQAACTLSCRVRGTLALQGDESCLKNLTSSGSLDAAQPACTMGFPQPQHTLTPVRWGVREVYPGWRKDVPRFQQHARAGSKPQLPFPGEKWEEARITYQKEHSLQQEAIKRTGDLKRNLLQATLEVQTLGDWNSGLQHTAPPPWLQAQS